MKNRILHLNLKNLNRTILELKPQPLCGGLWRGLHLNRTILELKQANAISKANGNWYLNRTILELKQSKIQLP